MRHYTKTLLGPNPAFPFRVVDGIVVVHLARDRSIVIPAGGGWPGVEHLPPLLLTYLQPERTSCLPGTRIQPDDEAGRPAALALVLGQALTAVGTMHERRQFAESLELPLKTTNRTTAGLLIGTTRVSLIRKTDK